MIDNVEFPDDLIGKTQEEITRLTGLIDDTVPYTMPISAQGAVLTVLLCGREMISALDRLREILDKASSV